MLLVASRDLSTLQVSQATCFCVDILDFLVSLGIEIGQFLSSGGSQGLLEITANSSPAGGGLVGDSVTGIDSLGFIRSFELCIEVGQRIREPCGNSVLIVKCYGPLNRCVRENISLGKILCNDAGTWLVVLGNFVVMFMGAAITMAS